MDITLLITTCIHAICDKLRTTILACINWLVCDHDKKMSGKFFMEGHNERYEENCDF